MQRRDVQPGEVQLGYFAVQAMPRPLRFRTEAEPSGDPLHRRWQAVYSYGEGWSRFHIVINLGRHVLTLQRLSDADYSAMLRALAGRPEGSLTPLPPPSIRVESLSFDLEVVGLKMARQNAGAFRADPSGDWLVVQAYLPRSVESFLLGVNDRLNAGELIIAKPESTPAVVRALSQVFG
ncbi:MAG: hypothetical protein AMS25_09920 [Gemmatimonas sp. SM23_52]|nr:MAG: hypothetical protein AMS25_09920 [Gemmatimonas sp. SM23_52]